MKYPGGKNHGSSYPRIINQIPPHSLYVEPFAGSAAIRRMMRPSARTILIDLDRSTIGSLAELVPDAEVLNVDAITWLEVDREHLARPRVPTVIYCDPPYLASACASRLRYEHVLSDDQHERLLRRCKQLRCYVLISGYWSELYADWLKGWRVVSWPQITRGGTWAQEFLWCNFPEPVELHDYQHLGVDFRERQDVKRQQQRWRRKLAAMTTLKRQALMSVLATLQPGAIGESAERIHGPGAIGISTEPAGVPGRSTNGKTAVGGPEPSGRHGGNAVEADGDITSAVLPIAPGRIRTRRNRRAVMDPAAAAAVPPRKYSSLGGSAEPGRRSPPANSAVLPIAAATGKNADGGHQTTPTPRKPA